MVRRCRLSLFLPWTLVLFLLVLHMITLTSHDNESINRRLVPVTATAGDVLQKEADIAERIDMLGNHVIHVEKDKETRRDNKGRGAKPQQKTMLLRMVNDEKYTRSVGKAARQEHLQHGRDVVEKGDAGTNKMVPETPLGKLKTNGDEESQEKEFKQRKEPKRGEPEITGNKNVAIDYRASASSRLPFPTTTKPSKHINPHDYKYIINNDTICKGVDQLKYIIYFHTSPEHFERRILLRKTWAKPNLIPGYESRAIYMVGKVNDTGLMRQIVEEAAKYGDIIQEDYVDSYRTLVYKGMSALKWISRYCRNVDYVIHSDDDVYVDMFMLMRLLHTKYAHHTRFIFGLVWQGNMEILRGTPGSCKWCIPKDVFPGQTMYPRYCAGYLYLMHGSIVPQMYQSALDVPFFWVDDVFISGLVPQKVGNITYFTDHSLFTLKPEEYRKQFDNMTATSRRIMVTLEADPHVAMALNLKHLSKDDIDKLGTDRYQKLLAEVSHIKRPVT